MYRVGVKVLYDDHWQERLPQPPVATVRSAVRSFRHPMTCPLCGKRKARRTCPALSKTICSRCCGIKRLTEIRCPNSCPHLAMAREHPAAEVKRRQEADVLALLPSMEGLTERQQQLFFVFHGTIARHTRNTTAPLVDDDVAAAAAACATTLETASRGVIYEQQPAAAPAQRLAGELTVTLEQMRAQGPIIYDSEAARALRAIERGARVTRKTRPGDRAYLALMGRLLQVQQPPPAGQGEGRIQTIIAR